jgi:SAM-dependent methyltransferase
MYFSNKKYFEIMGMKKFFKNYINYIFDDLILENKNLLDVGSGNGKYGFYAAISGARKVTCLEPGCEGSSSSVKNDFYKYKKILNLSNIELIPTRLQDFGMISSEKYDIILLHNSINHVDENACITLKKDKNSWENYRKIAEILFHLANSNASLIIVDCSSKNFFHTFNIKNPFSPQIEWNKHQRPEEWIKIFLNAGFKNPEINWTTSIIFPNSIFGNIGKKVFDNNFISFFTLSHFRLIMKK